MHKFLFNNKFIVCLYMFRALCAPHQEVKNVLYSIWYNYTCRWPSGAQVERGLSQPVGGCPVHKLKEDCLNLCNGQPTTGVMIPDAV